MDVCTFFFFCQYTYEYKDQREIAKALNPAILPRKRKTHRGAVIGFILVLIGYQSLVTYSSN